jgi:hypothetical protein
MTRTAAPRRPRRWTGWLVPVAVLVLLAPGCADPPSAAPLPAPGTLAAAPAVLPPTLDVSALQTQPCDALTVEQATSVGFPGAPRQYDDLILGSAVCVWSYAPITSPAHRTLRVIAFAQPYLVPFGAPGVGPLTTLGGYSATVGPARPTDCDVDVQTAAHHLVSVSYGATEFAATPAMACVVAALIAQVIVAGLPALGPVP